MELIRIRLHQQGAVGYKGVRESSRSQGSPRTQALQHIHLHERPAKLAAFHRSCSLTSSSAALDLAPPLNMHTSEMSGIKLAKDNGAEFVGIPGVDKDAGKV